MSWSRVYKREECQNPQLLRFSDFAEGKGGMVVTEGLFRTEGAPKSLQNEASGGAVPVSVNVEAKIEE
ncbi:MAG: hypothetical protein P8X63_08195, partial [Desulfuromonadaceae bacterium]